VAPYYIYFIFYFQNTLNIYYKREIKHKGDTLIRQELLQDLQNTTELIHFGKMNKTYAKKLINKIIVFIVDLNKHYHIELNKITVDRKIDKHTILLKTKRAINITKNIDALMTKKVSSNDSSKISIGINAMLEYAFSLATYVQCAKGLSVLRYFNKRLMSY
jgi:hypothetical protein